ncbi:MULTISPECIES: hypothetical protein [unclassified Streptomyces]|uniref:hypothetical protein n=1 Tax=unclassified Streptomyces TaxID=2593676 RepID=UPI0015A0A469|nr:MULTISPECIES: hypothetical protein [unclassified Streptomyces]
MSNNGVRKFKDHHDEVVTSQSGVPPAVPIIGLVVSVIALGVSLLAFRRARQAERRASYPRVRVQLTWTDAPSEAPQPDDPFADFTDEQRKNSLLLGIRSEGNLGFNGVRARVKFRRAWRLRSVSTSWASVDMPQPEQDQAGQYSAYGSLAFRPFGNWAVRNVGLHLHAVTAEPVALWAQDPWHRRILVWLLHRIGALEDRGRRRRVQRQQEEQGQTEQEQGTTEELLRKWMETYEWAEQHRPWWWRVRLLRLRLVAALDRGDPDTRIYATVQVAWRVAQHGGEVVRLAQRHTYRLSFARSAPMEGVISAHRFSGASQLRVDDPRYRYRLRLPGGSSGTA